MWAQLVWSLAQGRQSHSLLSVLIQAQLALVVIGLRCIWTWAAQVELKEMQPLDFCWMPPRAMMKLGMLYSQLS